MSTYIRKTYDEYHIESYYPGAGWSTETKEETWADAKRQLKCYRENFSCAPLRIHKKRVKIGGDE